MNAKTTKPAITQKAYKAICIALDRLDRVHQCDHAAHVARVSTPGFDLLAGVDGISLWTCATCQPIVEEIITRHCGSADVARKAS